MPTSTASPSTVLNPRSGFLLLLSLLAAMAIAKAVMADSMDPDAFWHVRVAEQLHRDGISPLVDSLSYSSDKTPWTPYSWLAELFMEWVWDHGTYRATIVVTALCSATVIFVSGLTSAPQQNSAHLTAIFATVLLGYFTLPFISFRPVTFALAILAVNVFLLYRDRRNEMPTKLVWLVPLLTLLQTNLHIYSVFSLATVMLIAVGTFFENRKRFMPIAVVAFLTLFAACGTPMLKGMVETSLKYNAVDPMVAANFISEMRPFYAGFGGKISLVIVAALLACAFAKRDRLKLTDWLLIAFGLVVLFRLGRFAPVFAIICMPIFARAMPVLSDRLLTKKPVRFAFAFVLVLCLVKIATDFPYRQTFDQWLNRFAPEIPGYPTKAAAFAIENIKPRTHRIINEFDWGGYFAWRFGPEWQVLLDGRTQLYKPDFWNRIYFSGTEAQQKILAEANADVAIVPARKSAFRDSLNALGWRVVYEDDAAVVLEK